MGMTHLFQNRVSLPFVLQWEYEEATNVKAESYQDHMWIRVASLFLATDLVSCAMEPNSGLPRGKKSMSKKDLNVKSHRWIQ